MNIIGEVKIKENITIYDLANVIETVVSFIIRKENGEIKYRPYYKELALNIAIIQYLIDGIEIEKDYDTDSILSGINEHYEVSEVVNQFIQNNDYYGFIITNVSDIVEQKKQGYSAPDFSDIKERLLKSIEQEQMLNNLNIKFAKKQNTLLSQQIKANDYQLKMMDNMTPEEMTELNKKFLSEEFDFEKIADIAVKHYLNSDIYKSKKKDLDESKQSKVVDMNTYNAKNVLADVDDGK